MKKALVLLLLLVCVGAFVFADAPAPQGQFHAWNRGVFIPYIQYGSNAASAGWGPPWDNPKGADQEWTFAFDSPTDKNGNAYGFSATAEWGGDAFFGAGSQGSGSSNLGGAYTWFDTYYKFGTLVKFQVGKPRVTDWSVFSPIEGNGMNEWNTVTPGDYMGYFEFYPTAGANIMAGLFIPEGTNDAQGSAFANALAGTAPNLADNFVVAGSYAVPNLVTINAFFKEQQAFGATSSTSTNKYFTINGTVSAIQGASIVFVYSANFTNSANLVNNFMVGGSDTMSALTIQLEVAGVNDTAGTSFAAQAELEYALGGAYGIGAQVGYDDGNGINWFDWGTGDWAGVEIYPYVIAHFDNGSRIRVGVVYATGATPSFTDSTGAIAPGNNEAKATIAVPIDYIWSF